MNDTIADLITRVRNAQRAKKELVAVPYSKMKSSICDVLVREGYIQSVETEGKQKKTLSIVLKYHEGRPVIENIK